MQKADQDGQGRVEAPVFREILREGTGVYLTDEQIYELLTCLDPELTGTLPYTRLLDNTEAALISTGHASTKTMEHAAENQSVQSEEKNKEQSTPTHMEQ